MSKAIIAVPMGDPAGIGPEIVVKAVSKKEIQDIAKVLVIGDGKILEKAVEICKLPIRLQRIETVEELGEEKDTLYYLQEGEISLSDFTYGKVSAMCGQAAFSYIKKSIELANEKLVDAVATTPINKESLKAAGVPFIGHTEIFGALTHTEDPLTMFECNGMRVFFLTRHVSLRQMLDMITKERIKDYVKRCLEAL